MSRFFKKNFFLNALEIKLIIIIIIIVIIIIITIITIIINIIFIIISVIQRCENTVRVELRNYKLD